ncbi:heterokaryon incompatibility protein-domain-containing protein [Cladorrhinum sp. PSN332]|nr:heterokaryon incompatibility protein-domain-containing protein [Cladorrhinum sp. PSN332]
MATSGAANIVCERCSKIFEHAGSLLFGTPEDRFDWKVILDEEYQVHMQNMMDSSECHMCSLLCASISYNGYISNYESGETSALQVVHSDKNSVHVNFVSYLDPEASEFSGLYGSIAKIEAARNDSSPRVCALESPVTWSRETLHQMRSWLTSCIESHDDCSKPGTGGTLPRRLIDVMPSGMLQAAGSNDISSADFDLLSLEQSPNVRIVSSKSLPPETAYLTLSHRWGNPPSILLTKDTSFLLQNDITPYLLECNEAAAFRHAIHVTRGLGFRYIWIDALCIMQDDGDEKTEDIIQMDAVYRNSALNISALEGRVSQGLMLSRNLLTTNPCQVTVRLPRLDHDLRLTAFRTEYSLRLTDGPLNKRGWVFQERALSPRVAHFTENQVFWECHTTEATETLPQGLQDGRPLSRFYMGTMISSSSSTEQLREQWHEVVETYSGTNLTFAGDRLVALSALTKRFCMAMERDPCDYLAGIWKNDLPLSLMWRQLNNKPDGHYNETDGAIAAAATSCAPSWSWASLMVPVNCVGHYSPVVATAEVLDTQLMRISRNYFDGVHFCRLRLRGWLCKFRRHIKDDSAWIHISQNCEFEHNDIWIPGRIIEMRWDVSRRVVANDLQSAVDGSGLSSSTYYMLHIATFLGEAGGKEDEDRRKESGIVLWRTAERGTYTRIGGFMMPSRTYYRGSEIEDAFKGNSNALGPDDYLERHSDGKYTIDIL